MPEANCRVYTYEGGPDDKCDLEDSRNIPANKKQITIGAVVALLSRSSTACATLPDCANASGLHRRACRTAYVEAAASRIRVSAVW